MGYQAPEKGHPFIAFEKRPRLAPGPDGQSVRARPSVYVRELVNIKVADYKEKTKQTSEGEFVTGRASFDAASVGLEHNFGASVQIGSKAAQILADAFENKTAVTVVIETSRRARTKDSSEAISPLTPIHELRGIVGDVTSAKAETTNHNCRVLIVCVNGEFTGELVSDPDEWEMLRENRDGLLAPAGWAVYEGAVIPPTSTAGPGTVDVRAQVTEVLQSFGFSHPAPAARKGPVRATHAAEAKPWENWNTDQRLNHGSYLATAIRETYAMASQLITSVGVSPSDSQPIVQALTETLLSMADRIQVGVYRRPEGTAVRSDRSHHEAREWIGYVTSTTPELAYTADMADPTDANAVKARNVWAKKVIAAAGRLMDSVATIADSGTPTGPDGVPVILPLSGTTALNDRFKALLAHADVGLTHWPDRVQPLLNDRFGTAEPHLIEAAFFAAALAEWEANPAAFLNAARASAAQKATEIAA
ncbi:hypothetical protein ACIBBE_45620 [Streptomyces sp. NPDC051644]|uniref:hypothetical protein n=1 Tax=Streptomyces sp. NPDC051644 TaxID=3365666 RepID=UPI0037A8EF8D